MGPPPPPKRIKRPPKVLDEDDYTDALSHIIARDYFPGLLETKAQEEFLSALDSKNPQWIATAGNSLREIMTPRGPGPYNRPSSQAARNSRFSAFTSHSQKSTPRAQATMSATPVGITGEDTPTSTRIEDDRAKEPAIDTTSLSLSAFQAKYTSEDNESFNSLLDKQNAKHREKHMHLWATDQCIPSARQIAHRKREAKQLKARADDEAAGRALVPITVGADEDRPAQPDSWKIKRPDNTLMFPPDSVDEDGLETVMEAKEHASRAGLKGVVVANTRLPQKPPPAAAGRTTAEGQSALQKTPSSPPLSAIQDAIAGNPRLSASEVDLNPSASTTGGGDTPRVKGYAFVDEDEPNPSPDHGDQLIAAQPTYRDLLAGQYSGGDGDSLNPSNPFKIKEMRRREDLHHRLVERQARRNRAVSTSGLSSSGSGTPGSNKQQPPRFPSSPRPGLMSARLDNTSTSNSSSRGNGNLTPAAKRLLDKVGRTPVSSSPLATAAEDGGGSGGARNLSQEKDRSREMWTPSRRTATTTTTTTTSSNKKQARKTAGGERGEGGGSGP